MNYRKFYFSESGHMYIKPEMEYIESQIGWDMVEIWIFFWWQQISADDSA